MTSKTTPHSPQYIPEDITYNPTKNKQTDQYLKVIIVGAGIAGIATSILLNKVPNLTYIILEMNPVFLSFENTAELLDIAGLENFQGPVVHTKWILPWITKGKELLLLATMQAACNNCQYLTRCALPTAPANNQGGYQYTPQDLTNFESDTNVYLEYRKDLDHKFHGGFAASKKGSVENAALRRQLTELMSERVEHDQELLSKLVSEYAPGYKLLTPAPGYFESLTNPKVTYVTDGIVRATESGLVTMDEQEHELDVSIAATGFPEFTVPRFPISVLLRSDGTEISEIFSWCFKSKAPRSAERCPCNCICKIQSQSYFVLESSQDATDDFDAVVRGFFSAMVSTDFGSSWWKLGKGSTPLTVAWPGSGLHKWDISRDPRWEDFVFHQRPGSLRNYFEYFCNGHTQKEVDGNRDSLTEYLKAVGWVDLRTIHEDWTEQE
ncbi:hypothetical protein BGW36DRAFT_406453 [Talaromyces proteolyticus]|uniref:FAD/NAD(P)-binding domain-containing protein n=1 Tax=Talaromyces proteolyticus TaxID=1131652 RepID=A0AAD4Q1F4_9EURO|nr:uncharacterized protein BGW36DRAFT_406453 [Talaromyces proteolyticus]KAH8698488.1 hypothetical protein BGW36DRAFT_406453 [Talaromyces proteolyticus]